MTDHEFSMLMVSGWVIVAIGTLAIYIFTGAWIELPLTALATWAAADEWRFDREFNDA